MPKTVTTFVCQECGYESPQWLGKCPECNSWNSFKEFHEQKTDHRRRKTDYGRQKTENQKPRTLQEIDLKETQRILTGFSEMDTVMGGGIVPGSVTLIAGDPGIGKSTLLLQLALQQKGVLYVSGEESVEQVKLRASRIKDAQKNLSLKLVSLVDTNTITSLIAEQKPALVIIDSIQTMESESVDSLSGSVAQVRYAANQFIRVAKELAVPIIIVGHVTKEGMVAGPMVLSHMVDTVLFLEGEKFTDTRLLRSLKNRFGPVDEVGVFRMDQNGMKEIHNPEEIFLTNRNKNISGSCLTVVMEGTRPFLVEVQALANFSKFPMPRRVAGGIDQRRVELLLAVLQKQCRLSVDSADIFVNIAGGLKIIDPAMDLAVCIAIASSLKNKPASNIVGIAEVGLLGELREAGNMEKRIREAKKLGFTNIITAKSQKSIIEALAQLE